MTRNGLKFIFRYFPLLVILGPIYPKLGLDGFPFNNKIEVILMLISLFFVLMLNKQINKRAIQILSIFFFISIFLSYFNSQNSFKACYSTVETPNSSFEMSFNIKNNCQFSFQKPFNKKITRNDFNLNFNNSPKNAKGIDFTNWNLYFFNQTGFNFYDKSFYGGQNNLDINMYWINRDNSFERVSYNFISENESIDLYDYGFTNIIQPLEPSRTWLSFAVNWVSKSRSIEQNILVSYVGEGSIKIDDDVVNLPQSYSKVSVLEINIPDGAIIEIDYFYRFNAGINSYPNIPYASFSITDIDNKSINPLQSSTESNLEIINLAIVIIIFLYLLFEINESRNVLSINFIFLILVLFLYEKIPNSFSDYIEILLVAVIGYFIFFRKIYKLRNFIGITLSLSILSVKNLNIKSNVLYTPGGSDPLKYESWSQQIVHFLSLQGGEDVFIYQPGYRYLLSLLHLLFGDSHIAISLFSRFIFLTLLLLFFVKIYQKIQSMEIFLFLNLIVMYILFSTYSSKLNLYSSLTEWPTWLLAIVISTYLFQDRLSIKDSNIVAVLIALCFLIRENQLPGLLVLLIILSIKSESRKNLISVITTAGVVALLPFIHNFYYGGKFVLQENIFREDVYYVSPIDIMFNFSDISEKLLFQLNYLFANPLYQGVSSMAGKIFPIFINFIILQWIYFLIRNLISKEKLSVEKLMFIILPIGFLSPHIFYQVHTYYPRHIIQGYFFMVVSTLYLASKNKIYEV